MMALGLIGTLASGAIGAMGAMQQANAASAAAQQNANIAEYNRKVSERNKNVALAQADADAVDLSRSNNRMLSRIHANYGASGLSLDGSPLDVLTDTSLEGALDVSKTRYKGELQAIGQQDQANNYAMKRDLYTQEASSAKRAGGISALGAIFGGFASAGKVGMSLAA